MHFVENLKLFIKVLLNLILPALDVSTDIYFTVEMYIKHEMLIFYTSVGILLFPALINLVNTVRRPMKRKDPKAYIEALFNQFFMIYLGFKNITNPGNKELEENYWNLKKNEVILESQFQLVLQIVILWRDGLPDETANMIIRILNLATSTLSLGYAWSSIWLRNILDRELTLPEAFRNCCTSLLPITLIVLNRIFLVVMVTISDIPKYLSILGGLAILVGSWLINSTVIIYSKNMNRTWDCCSCKFKQSTENGKTLNEFEKTRICQLLSRMFYPLMGTIQSVLYLTYFTACDIAFIQCEDGEENNKDGEENNKDGENRMNSFCYTLLTVSFLSTVQIIVEIVYFFFTKKTFFTWVYLMVLEERNKVKQLKEEDVSNFTKFEEGNSDYFSLTRLSTTLTYEKKERPSNKYEFHTKL